MTQTGEPHVAHNNDVDSFPALLVAGLLVVVEFGVVDPQDLHWLGQPMAVSRQAVCTLSFFVFSGLAMLSSGMTCLLSATPSDMPSGDQSA